MSTFQYIDGGVCAAKGFTANGLHCGIRKNKSKRDLALIYSEIPCSAAAVYTTNLVKGDSICVNQEHLMDGIAQAVIVNSGNANTCNFDGEAVARRIGKACADQLKIKEEDVLICSTGVIGQRLNPAPILEHLPELASGLSRDGSSRAVEGISTTDTVYKSIALQFELDGKTCHIGGIAKGSGMIHPNLATMLVFITTDVDIAPAMIKKALSTDVQSTFNMLSVDGDTSTNDMVTILANGLAGNKRIEEDGEAFGMFMQALNTINTQLSRMIVSDGEGATKMLECVVSGASDVQTARIVAKSVVCSSLLKAAMFGADANWGRVLCAIGYSGAQLDIKKVDVSFASAKGEIQVCKDGAGVEFSEEKAKEILLEKEIDILIGLNSGDALAAAWGCDLTYDYVKINGDYRT